MVWLRPATKAPHGSPTPPPGAEKNGKKQAETGGSGQGQFTRTAKGTVTTMIQIRRKQDTNRTNQRATLPDRTSTGRSRAASELPPPSSPSPEPSMTVQGTEYPVLFGQAGSAHSAVPLSGF